MLINFLYLALNFLYSQSNAFIFISGVVWPRSVQSMILLSNGWDTMGRPAQRSPKFTLRKFRETKILLKPTVKTSFLWLITTKWSYFLKWVRKNKHKLYTSLHFRYHYIYLTSQPSWDRTNVLSMAMGRRLKQQPTEPPPTLWNVTLQCIVNCLRFL